jgi:integrase
MASLRKRSRNWFYRFTDADGVKVEKKGCPDRRATEEMAREAATQAARTRAGLIDPLADWHAHLIAAGHTTKHSGLNLDRVRRVAALIVDTPLADAAPPRRTGRVERERIVQRLADRLGSARLADLTRDRAQSALAVLRAAGLSLQTLNHHRAACRAFTRWAWKDDRTAEDALIGLSGYNAKEDRRHDRRTLSVDELRRLIEAAHRGVPYRQMTGPTRALCYRLAVATGLRYSEIVSITPGSFDLSADAPTVIVAAAYTKNGEPATLPLPADLAADMVPLLAGMPPEAPVFPLPDKGAKMLRADLAVAGIPYRDASGLVFDFHSLRCQCVTLADAAGVSPRVVQRMMRHSTLELTGRYTRPRMNDLAGATAALPVLRPAAPEPMAATGLEVQPIGDRLAHHLPTGGDGSGRIGADTGGKATRENPPPMDHNPLLVAGLDALGRVESATGGSTPDRIRTYNLRFRRPMLYPIELRVPLTPRS